MGTKIERFKKHISDNKKVYITGGVCLAVGATVAVIVTRRTISIPLPELIINNTQTAVGWNNNQMIINLVENSTPSKPVHLVGTDLYFNSLNDAARKTGHSLSSLSNHINGKTPHLKGDVFELLTPA